MIRGPLPTSHMRPGPPWSEQARPERDATGRRASYGQGERQDGPRIHQPRPGTLPRPTGSRRAGDGSGNHGPAFQTARRIHGRACRKPGPLPIPESQTGGKFHRKRERPAAIHARRIDSRTKKEPGSGAETPARRLMKKGRKPHGQNETGTRI